MFKAILPLLLMFSLVSCSGGNNEKESVTDHKIVINEVFSNGTDSPDWIEIYNLGEDADLSGYSVRDEKDSHSYVFPDNTVVKSGEHLVFLNDEKSGFSFGLGKSDTVRLFDTEGKKVDEVAYGDIPENKSFGRIPSGTGYFKTLDNPTKEERNIDNLNIVIISPKDNTLFQVGDEITFSAVVKDSDGSEVEDCKYEWISDGDTTISNERNFKKNDFSVVDHKITLKVVDSRGIRGDKSVNIVVDNPPDTVQNDKALYINEFLVENWSVIPDPDYNNYVDWIEIYNSSDKIVDLGGYFLTDDLKEAKKWEIAQGVKIEPQSYLLFYADGMNSKNHTLL